MSDQPLFQDSDDQEAAYAPHQQPGGSQGARAADLDDQSHDDALNDEVGVPAAGAGLLSQAGGGFGGTAGVVNPVGPAVVSATPDDETSGPPPADE